MTVLKEKEVVMSTMTQKMGEAGSGHAPTQAHGTGQHHAQDKHSAGPKKGDRYRCDECGMAIQVTADCPCDNGDHVHFQCCDQEMHKV